MPACCCGSEAVCGSVARSREAIMGRVTEGRRGWGGGGGEGGRAGGAGDRVAHRFGRTHGFCCTGPAGTGPVSDLLTCANTVPVMGYPRVSATCSHARHRHVFALHLPSQFKGK